MKNSQKYLMMSLSQKTCQTPSHLFSNLIVAIMSDDLDRILRAEELVLAKDKEIDRVLQCCKYDYFAILEVNPLVDPETLQNRIKKIYRKKTLLLHPDKVKHEKAPEAFDLLKKSEIVLSQEIPAEGEVTDETDPEVKNYIREKQNLLSIYESAQQRLDLPITDSFSDENNHKIRNEVARVLTEQIRHEDVEKKYSQRQELQRQAEIKKLAKERELKKKLDSQWEDDRDKRVNNWRNYAKKVLKKKKKTSKNVLA